MSVEKSGAVPPTANKRVVQVAPIFTSEGHDSRVAEML